MYASIKFCATVPHGIYASYHGNILTASAWNANNGLRVYGSTQSFLKHLRVFYPPLLHIVMFSKLLFSLFAAASALLCITPGVKAHQMTKHQLRLNQLEAAKRWRPQGAVKRVPVGVQNITFSNPKASRRFYFFLQRIVIPTRQGAELWWEWVHYRILGGWVGYSGGRLRYRA
jgi:hypothetical protein